jgi:hypothetical protein
MGQTRLVLVRTFNIYFGGMTSLWLRRRHFNSGLQAFVCSTYPIDCCHDGAYIAVRSIADFRSHPS